MAETLEHVCLAMWDYACESTKNPRVRVLLMTLAEFHERDVTADELARSTGASTDRTRRALRKLREEGVVGSTQVLREGRWVYAWSLKLERLGL
jgi:transcription initiation factor IIE alpha subunit